MDIELYEAQLRHKADTDAVELLAQDVKVCHKHVSNTLAVLNESVALHQQRADEPLQTR